MTVKVARIVGLPTSSTASMAVRSEGLALLLPVVALDVLDHHDRVVHEDADREDEGEEGDPVQGVAGQEVDEEGEGEGDRHRDADHEAAPPAHGERDEGDHGEGRDEQVVDELVRLLLRRLAVVAGDVHVDLGGQEPRPQVLDLAQDAARRGALAFAPVRFERAIVTAGCSLPARGARGGARRARARRRRRPSPRRARRRRGPPGTRRRAAPGRGRPPRGRPPPSCGRAARPRPGSRGCRARPCPRPAGRRPPGGRR